MGTRTTLEVLGLTSLDGQVHGSSSDAAKDTSKPSYRDATSEEVERVSGEYADTSNPHSDQRRGGVVGTPSTVTPPHTEDADTVHDRYGGRGAGKKNISAGWDSSRAEAAPTSQSESSSEQSSSSMAP